MILCINNLEIALGYPILLPEEAHYFKKKEIACVSMSLAFLFACFSHMGKNMFNTSHAL